MAYLWWRRLLDKSRRGAQGFSVSGRLLQRDLNKNVSLGAAVGVVRLVIGITPGIHRYKDKIKAPQVDATS